MNGVCKTESKDKSACNLVDSVLLVGVQVDNLDTVTHAYVNLLLNRWHMSIHACIPLCCELKDSKRNDTP